MERATSYINTVINSSSVTEAISRVTAMSEIVAANNKMLEQQKKDKEVISENKLQIMKPINTVIANQQQLADDEQTWLTKQAELKAAQAALAAEKQLLKVKRITFEQKAAAQKAAEEAAAREAVYKAEQDSTTPSN